MIIDSFPWSFIINPLSIINVAIDMNKFAFAIGFIVVPIALVSSSVRPNLNSRSFSRIASPASIVNYAITEPDGRFFNYLLILVLSCWHWSHIKIWLIFFRHAWTAKLNFSYYPADATFWAWLGPSSIWLLFFYFSLLGSALSQILHSLPILTYILTNLIYTL